MCECVIWWETACHTTNDLTALNLRDVLAALISSVASPECGHHRIQAALEIRLIAQRNP